MKRTKLFRALCLTMAALALCAVCACGTTEPEESTPEAAGTTAATLPATTATPETSTTPVPTSATTTTPPRLVTTTEPPETSAPETTHPKYCNDPLTYNFLTGELLTENEDGAGRPTVVVINNLRVAAQYQSGLSQADLVYEVETEGGITRLLAVFLDPSKTGTLGSIRSARPVMIAITLGFDGYFVHAGGSSQAYKQLSKFSVPDIDGAKAYAGYFYYDQSIVRATSLEHGYFTSGSRVAKAVASYDDSAKRTAIKYGYNEFLRFYGEPTDLGGEPATRVTTKYGGYTPSFVYSESTGLYYRYQYGAPHLDFQTGTQLAFTNVLVLSVTSHVIEGDSAGRRAFDDVGSGTGILASRGTAIPVRWEKENYKAPLKLYTESGEPLTANVGKTFVSYVNGESNIVYGSN